MLISVRRIILSLIGLSVLALLTLMIETLMEDWRSDVRNTWNSVTIGDSEADVIEKLGEPALTYGGETAPADYYVSGWARKERPITGKVCIYMRKDLILYIWLDGEGRVEDMFIGGS